MKCNNLKLYMELITEVLKNLNSGLYIEINLEAVKVFENCFGTPLINNTNNKITTE